MKEQDPVPARLIGEGIQGSRSRAARSGGDTTAGAPLRLIDLAQGGHTVAISAVDRSAQRGRDSTGSTSPPVQAGGAALLDELSEEARASHAVNTGGVSPDGKRKGFNTDHADSPRRR